MASADEAIYRRYFELVRRFEALTGIGGVLNTSFNLHGEPVVCTPDAALSTFARSGLQHLALGDCLLTTSDAGPAEEQRERTQSDDLLDKRAW